MTYSIKVKLPCTLEVVSQTARLYHKMSLFEAGVRHSALPIFWNNSFELDLPL
jgi:hypothetical protein